MYSFVNVWKAQNKFLVELVPSKYKTTKMRRPRDQLAETTTVAPDEIVQMGRQKKNTASNVEKETTLPTNVDYYAKRLVYH